MRRYSCSDLLKNNRLQEGNSKPDCCGRETGSRTDATVQKKASTSDPCEFVSGTLSFSGGQMIPGRMLQRFKALRRQSLERASTTDLLHELTSRLSSEN